jgi:PAS domain S-box-containing protein
MKLTNRPAMIKLFVAGLLVCFASALSAHPAYAQPSSRLKRVLVLYWYNKDHPWNVGFDQGFQHALQSSVDPTVEYYAEYLETNRFPGEKQALLLRDYLKAKYADRPIDIVVANSDYSLNFLLNYREELFTDRPVVFVATKSPPNEQLEGAGLTGILNINAYKENLDLALKLHPHVQQVFVISGTLDHDKRFETLARQELQGYESKVQLVYLTDLSLEELVAKTKSLPARSIILHVWQQSLDKQGRLLENGEMLAAIGRSTNVPLYAMNCGTVFSQPQAATDRTGIIGGYVTTARNSGSKAAEIALKIANGARPQDIPVQNAPVEPIFDWRELQRWGINENQLPPGSIVEFRQVTFWTQYKWRILLVTAVLLLQTSLIAGLLIERRRRSRATRGLTESEERYRNVVQTQTELICRYLPDTTLTFVNDAYCRYFGKRKEELLGTKFIELIPENARPLALSHVQSLLNNPRIEIHEHEAILPDGTTSWQQWINHVIVSGNGRIKELQGIGRDITERKLAEEALQVSEKRFAKAFSANPQPMSLTTLDDGRYIDVNESFLQMSGYDRREVIGSTSLELGIFQEPEDRERLVGPLRENGSVRNLELKFRTKGGEFRILLSSAELIQLGGQPCVLVASSDITERKRLEEQHLHAENELSQLTARLFNLQDEERRRIARELHDGTAQNLFAISIDIDLMRKQTSNGDSEINSLLDESATLCEQSLQEIRTLSYLLHPPLLDQVGLVSALKWYVEGFTKRTGIEVNVVALEGVGRMGSEIETALFRIVQESLSNIRRHSGSETANIRLRRDSREITLEIKDQGKGMNVHEHFGPTAEMPELGVGIPGMRQRLRQLGGRLDIVSSASGTFVTAVIPLTDVPGNGTKPS